jgi:uncharacterized OB-fold protein
VSVTDTIVKPVPRASPVTQPFWDAAREERLLVQHCRACGRWVFYPRQRCPLCWADELEWREACGRGHLASFTIMERAGHPAFIDDVPYVVALVDLEEGPRMLTNIVEVNPSDLEMGQGVQVVWQHLDDHSLPQFRPTAAADDRTNISEVKHG